MKLYLKIFLCASVLVFNNCKNANKLEISEITKKVISVKEISKNQVGIYSEFYDSIKIVKLEKTDSSLIGRIDKLIFYDNKYYILDQVLGKSIFVFDEEGKFIRRIGNIGKGPGEYDEPNDMALDGDSKRIYIYCHNKKVLLNYDLNGRFLNEIRLKYYMKSFSILDTNIFAFYFDYDRESKPEHDASNLILMNKQGKILNSAFDDFKFIGPRKGGISFFSHQDRGDLTISPGYSNRVYSIYEDSIICNYLIDFGKENIPVDLLNETNKNFDSKINKTDFAFINNYFELDKYLVFSFVQKGQIFSCIYSKDNDNLKYAKVWINDLFGLFTGGMIHYAYDDKIITSYDPSSISNYHEIIKSSSILKKSIKEILIENLDKLPTNDIIATIKEKIEDSEFSTDSTEIDLINNINELDNPVLITCKIKRF